MPRVNVKDKRKQQLIDANITSIAKRGLSETTIAHVSQGAGMSRGIVNFYFTTKESMMQETCQYLADEYAGAWERAMEKADANDAEVTLKAIIAGHFAPALCNQKKLAVWVAFWGHASSHAAYKKIIAEADARFADTVSKLWSKLQGASVPADVFAYELNALIRGSWLNFLLASASSDREVLAQKCQQFLIRALSAEVVAKKPAKAKNDNVTELKPVIEDKPVAKKKKSEPKDEAPALGDLFAMGL